MPLRLPDQPPEHPDVTDLKNRVRQVANDYKRRYNWCAEINAALCEAGIDTPDAKIEVSIRFSLAGSDEQTAVKVFEVGSLMGLTHEEQVAWIAEQIAPKVDVAGVQVTLPVTVHDIDGEYTPKEVVVDGRINVDGLSYPQGYIHFYISADGRVAHLARSTWDPATQTPQRALHRLRDAARYSRTRAICGAESYGPVSHSSRSEHRICGNCTSRATDG